MSQKLFQSLDEISESMYNCHDINDATTEGLWARISSLSTQIAMRKGLDDAVKLVQLQNPLPVRRIGFNIKKLSEVDQQQGSRWSQLQELDIEDLIFCTLSFTGLLTLPSEQFHWLVQNVHRYLRAQSLPHGWIARDQIRKVLANIPRGMNTKSFLENYYQFEIQVCGIGELHDADNEPPIEQSKESQLSRGTSAVTETDQRSTGVLNSVPPIRSTILPLTAEGAEVIPALIRQGLGEGLTITFPNPQVQLPFITIPHHVCVNIMRKYTS